MTIERRVHALEKLLAEPSEAHPSRPNPDKVAVLDELALLKGSRAVHYRGGVRIEPENIPQKILGNNYTERECRELAIKRAFTKRGYSTSEIAERMPRHLARLEYFDSLIRGDPHA
jgi:hypothetical protein